MKLLLIQILALCLLVGAASASSTSSNHVVLPQERLLQGAPPTYAVGLPVYQYFEDDDKWYLGVISEFSDADGTYSIVWSDESSDSGVSEVALQEPVQNAINMDYDDLWVLGTVVWLNEDNIWYRGIISGQDSSSYTVNWDDQEVETVSAAAVDEMVLNSQTQAYADFDEGKSPADYDFDDDNSASGDAGYPAGTVLYKQEDDVWVPGTVDDYDEDSGMYTVVFHGEASTASAVDVAAMVGNAANLQNGAAIPAPVPSGDAPFPEGTEVYKYFFDEAKWYQGSITFFSEQDSTYVVQWTDGDVATYSDVETSEMVENAVTRAWDENEIPDQPSPDFASQDDATSVFPRGTPVFRQFEDGGYYGQIVDYAVADGSYTVEWSDGSVDRYNDMEEIQGMIFAAASLAQQQPQQQQGGGATEKRTGMNAGLVMFLVGGTVAAAGAGYYGYKKKMTGIETITVEDFDGAPKYTDTEKPAAGII